MRGVERAGMLSLAVSYPSEIRQNDYFKNKYPQVVADAEKRTLAKIWAKPEEKAPKVDAFDVEMAPFLGDPFRGSVRRRVLAKGETALSLELAAAREALTAANMSPGDI